MKFIADFHIHSKYSRATSADMDLDGISKWAKIKGIDLIGTSDFTHPIWFAELKQKLEPLGNGIFKYKDVNFILSTEVSNIYKQDGKTRKVHSIILAPDFQTVEKINLELAKYGKIASDGRPILKLSLVDMAEIVLDAGFIIPAHAWTPHFSIFGSGTGFSSIEEAFGKYAKYIRAIETGLSSDPAMNWRLSKLDDIGIISNSDAHSPKKLGREANVLDCGMDYESIITAISGRNKSKFLYTIEFFPEEGKYHYDGHRKCNVCWHPRETKKYGSQCPVCGKRLTVGVMHRVEDLADREEGVQPKNAIPFKSIIPLAEIISGALEVGVNSKKVEDEYFKLIEKLGPEFMILLDVAEDEIKNVASEKIARGIVKMREGEVSIKPGFDGEYGTISLYGSAEPKRQPEILQLF